MDKRSNCLPGTQETDGVVTETNYDKYYETQLKDGLEYQDFVGDTLCNNGIVIMNYVSKKYQYNIGENKTGIEIKHDKKFRETQNLYIELSEKSNPANLSYTKSGIHRSDNTWLYTIGDYKTIYIFAKKTLCKLSGQYRPIENKTKTSWGFLLPITEADKYCAKVINIP